MNKSILKASIIPLLIHTLFWAIINYFFVPGYCLVRAFWIYHISFVVLLFIFLISSYNDSDNISFSDTIGMSWLIPAGCSLVTLLIIAGLSFIIYSPIFHKDNYISQISPVDATFVDVVEEFDVNKVQTLDKAAAQSIGDRTFGTIGSDSVSRFSVSDLYTQQVYKEKLVRVTPAEYNGIGSAFSNCGTPGYIIVDVVTGEAEFIKTEPMIYVPSAVLNHNLQRHVRFDNFFGDFNNDYRFEIDDNGNPFFITTTYDIKGTLSLKNPNGVIIVNPINGDIKRYSLKDVPSWVDIVYTPSEIISEFRNYGSYQLGVWNKLTSKRGVLSTTDDYSYLLKDNQLYMYTGITSASNDESNVGFIYTNLHNQDTSYIKCVGAEEYSAKSAAEGAVQEKDYSSTFPVLVNVKGKPTYFLSLKDYAGLIKAYAFVDVIDYTKVNVSDSKNGVLSALDSYKNMLISTSSDEANSVRASITVKTIVGYSLNSSTYFYITDEKDNKYIVNISVSNMIPFVQPGDIIDMEYINEEIKTITKLYFNK